MSRISPTTKALGQIATVLATAWAAFELGHDSRRCATGPSPEEETMRAMHEKCTERSGAWRWYFDKQNLEMDATCIGGE